MKKVKVLKLVVEAQEQLIKNPFDLAHDITHHYRVHEGALRIIEEEKLTADEDLVTVCAWYHDLGGRRAEDVNLLKSLIGKYIKDLELVDRIIQIIREHSFGESQSSIESKILYDADKLEYVNPMRLTLFLKAANEGLISKDSYLQYKKEWKERIPQVEKQLNFSYTKRQFKEMLPKATLLMKG